MKDFLLKDAAKILNINYSTAKTILRIFRLEKRISKKNTPDLNCLKDIKRDNLKKFQNVPNKKNEFSDRTQSDLAYESISHSTFLTNNNINNNSSGNTCLEAQQQLLIKNIQEAFPSLISEVNLLNAQKSANEDTKENLSSAISKINMNTSSNLLTHSQQINLFGDQINLLNANQIGVAGAFNNCYLNNKSQFNSTSCVEQTNNLIIYMNLSQTIQNLASMVGVCYENLKFNQNMINLIMNQISK